MVPPSSTNAALDAARRHMQPGVAWDVHMERRAIRLDTRAAAEEHVAAGFPERHADALVCSLVQLMICRLAITAVI